MNKRQKIVLWVGIIVFVLIGLATPKKQTGLFRRQGQVAEVDLVRLCTYWSMTVVVTGGLIYTFKDSKPKDEQDNK
jgi:hypothetical protein